ncbi:MAG: hypothetical protein AB1758_36105, partial [Candidatus Eremiobacterota bacterium]
MPPHSRRLALGCLTGLLLAGCLATLPGTPARWPEVSSFLLLALLAEFTAIRLSEGWVSLGYGVYLAAARILGPGWAAILLLTASGARLFYRKGSFLQEAWPGAAGLAVTAALGTGPFGLGGGVAAYLALRWLPSKTPWPLFNVPLALGLMLASSHWLALALMTLLFPLVARLVRLENRPAVERPGEDERVQQYRSALGRSLRDLDLVRRDLKDKLDEALVLEELTHALAGVRTVRQCMDVVVAVVSRCLAARSVVLFLQEEDGLVPAAYRSPQAEA